MSVTSEATLVQTNGGARSGLITRENIEDIALKGRDFAGMLKILPGVVDTSAREAPGWGSMGGLTINGRSGGFNFSYDGVTNKDTGSNSGNYAAPALDSIAEVRVQASNFQAEYGRSSGATISVITRSGTKDFHGTAAFYKRDDKWNGNEFLRKQQCGLGVTAQCDPPLYDFDNTAWTLGGPVLIPGTDFNKGRNKLFFFWSQDILARTDPGTLNQRRMPTALERSGDFSQTFDAQGRLIFIRDPRISGGNCNSVSGGTGCFENNRIPASRINPTAQALLNLFPLPNATDPTGANNYNYTFQTVQDWPRNDQVLRMDWNVGPRHDLLRPAAVRLREASRRRLVPWLDGRRLAAAAEQVRDRYRQLRQYAAAHVQPDRPSRSSRSASTGRTSTRARSTRLRLTTTTETSSCRACHSTSRTPTPIHLLPQASFAGGSIGQQQLDRVVQRRIALAVLRLQHGCGTSRAT